MATSFWQEKAGTGGAEEIEEYGSILASEARTRRKKRERRAKKIELIGAGLLLGDQLMSRNAAKKAREWEETTGNGLLNAAAADFAKISAWRTERDTIRKTGKYDPDNIQDVQRYFVDQQKKLLYDQLADEKKPISTEQQKVFSTVLSKDALEQAKIKGLTLADKYNKRYERYNKYEGQDVEAFSKPIKDYVTRVSNELATDPRNTSVLRSIFSKIGLDSKQQAVFNDNINMTIEEMHSSGKLPVELLGSELDEIAFSRLQAIIDNKKPLMTDQEAILSTYKEYKDLKIMDKEAKNLKFTKTERDGVGSDIFKLISAEDAFLNVNGEQVSYADFLEDYLKIEKASERKGFLGLRKQAIDPSKGWITRSAAGESFIQSVVTNALTAQEQDRVSTAPMTKTRIEYVQEAFQDLINQGAINEDKTINTESLQLQDKAIEALYQSTIFDLKNGATEESKSFLNLSIDDKLKEINSLRRDANKSQIEKNSPEYMKEIYYSFTALDGEGRLLTNPKTGDVYFNQEEILQIRSQDPAFEESNYTNALGMTIDEAIEKAPTDLEIKMSTPSEKGEGTFLQPEMITRFNNLSAKEQFEVAKTGFQNLMQATYINKEELEQYPQIQKLREEGVGWRDLSSSERLSIMPVLIARGLSIGQEYLLDKPAQATVDIARKISSALKLNKEEDQSLLARNNNRS